MRSTDTGLTEHGQRVVILQGELPARVEPEPSPATGLLKELTGSLHDLAHRGIPVARHQPAIASNERLGEPITGLNGLPAVQVFRTQPPSVDSIQGSSTYTDDPIILDGKVVRVTVGVKNRRRLHPPIYIGVRDTLGEVHVLPDWPRPGVVRGSRAPWICDPISHTAPSGVESVFTAQLDGPRSPGIDGPSSPVLRSRTRTGFRRASRLVPTADASYSSGGARPGNAW